MAGESFCRAWSPPDVDADPSPTTAAAVDMAATSPRSVGNLRAAAVAEAHGGSHELLTVAPGSLAVGAEIGKGHFKRVHRGWHRRFGAVVVLRFDDGQDANELNILKFFHAQGGCQNIPKVLGLCGDRVVQECALWGSLKGAVQDREIQSRLSPAHKRCLAAQIAAAGSFLVNSRIVHADLSCRNILLFWLEEEPKFSIAKVTDFGLAVNLPKGTDFVQRKQPQATRWCSPETVAHLTLSHRSDVWSLGTTLWELFSNGTAPWSRRSKRSDVSTRLRDLAENNGAAEGGPDVSNDFPLARSACGSTVHNLVLSCLQADEYARPSFTVLQQSFEQISQVAQAPVSLDAESEEDESRPATSRKASTVSTMDTAELGEKMCVDIRPCRSWHSEGLLRQQASPRDMAPSAFRERMASMFTSATGHATLNSHEHVVPLVQSTGKLVESKLLPPPHPDAWTLTTYVQPALRRQDFAYAEEAWAAFEADKEKPCVLRGPRGVEAAARAWVPSPLMSAS